MSPGKFGIAVVSPPLDEAGNSVRAQKAIADISNAVDGNPYAATSEELRCLLAYQLTPAHRGHVTGLRQEKVAVPRRLLFRLVAYLSALEKPVGEA